MKQHKIIPPALAQKILLRFLREDLAEEVLGDLDEKFYLHAKTKSPFKANCIVHSFHPGGQGSADESGEKFKGRMSENEYLYR